MLLFQGVDGAHNLQRKHQHAVWSGLVLLLTSMRILDFVSTFSALAQVTRVYLSLAESTTSTILLPIFKQTIDEQNNAPTSGSPKAHSKRSRSITGTSTLSCLARANNPDSLLSKFTILLPNEEHPLGSVTEQLKSDTLAAYQGNAEIVRDIESLDFAELFSSLLVRVSSYCQPYWNRKADRSIRSNPFSAIHPSATKLKIQPRQYSLRKW